MLASNSRGLSEAMVFLTSNVYSSAVSCVLTLNCS